MLEVDDAWLAADPDGDARLDAMEELAVVSRSRTTVTERGILRTSRGPVAVHRKRYHYPDAAARLKGAFRTTFLAAGRARRERDALRRLRDLGPPHLAPPPVALREERVAGFLVRATLWVRTVEGAADLGHLAPDDALARAVGAAVGRIHGAGLGDLDLAPRNLLARRAGEGWEVSKVDSMRLRRVRPGGSAVARDLATLLAGLEPAWDGILRHTLMDTWQEITGSKPPSGLLKAMTVARTALHRRRPRSP